ncbi:MAG TPA: DNA alkylation repair protein [Candidatus Saccharibacteria bacterium]|nr:DNA alkylation repair protein [Candidatus Saccharibacteria bacterium]
MDEHIEDIKKDLRQGADTEKAAFLPHFFKPEDSSKDIFLGVTVPKQRIITRRYYKVISPKDVERLLHSVVHEERLTALMIWVLQFKAGDDSMRRQVYELYLSNTQWINNWDLVDCSARDIVGGYLFDRDKGVLTTLASSDNVWERRIAIIATFFFIQNNQYDWTLRLAEQLMNDTHHYIHKATGWMLREMGKRDEQLLRSFLDTYAPTMPRTELRYAIEKFNAQDRAHYLLLKNKTNQNK